MALSFNSVNLLTGYKQLRFINEIEIYCLVLLHKQKVDSGYIKNSVKTYQLVFYKRNIDSC